MRTIKTWLATIAVLLCSISASAYDFEVDGIYYNILSAADRTVEVDSYDYEGDIVIPSIVKFNNIDFTVTSIEEYGFSPAMMNSQLTSVILPNTLVNIGSRAFCGCTNIKIVTIPEGVTTISEGLFDGCDNLEEVKISSKTTAIGDYAFRGCRKLKTFDFSKTLRRIGSYAFSGCENFTYFKIPNTSLFIYDSAFANSVKIIWQQPFGHCNCVTSFDHDEVICIIKYEEQKADFDGDGIAESTITSDYMCWEGGDYYRTFLYDPNFTDTEIQTLLETGGRVKQNGVEYRVSSLRNTFTMEVFRADDGITTADIASKINYLNREFTVTSIRGRAFANNTALTTVKIPSSIQSIGNNAFTGCTSISKVTTESTTPLTINDGCFDAMTQLFATLYVPTGAVSAYKSANVWKGFGVITEAGVSYKTITMKANAGGTIACGSTAVSNGTEYVNTSNNSVEFTITPKAYYTLAKVLVDGTDVTSQVNNGVLTINVTADTEIEAIFDTQSEVLLQDEQTSFELESNISCDKITYTRNFTNTTWQPLYVPFEIPVTEEFLKDFEIAYINDARQYDHNDDGKKDETIIEAFKIKTGTLEANYPYLIRAKEIGEKTITVTDATLYKAEENYIDCSSVYDTYTFTGTYERMSSDDLSGCYSLSGGLWSPVAEGGVLGAFRMYLRIESRKSNAAPAQAIRMRVIGDGETTDIGELESIDNEEQPTIIYDLQGRRVKNTKSLKGIYVVNGRKVAF